MTEPKITITVEGPRASGKSIMAYTIARLLTVFGAHVSVEYECDGDGPKNCDIDRCARVFGHWATYERERPIITIRTRSK